MDKKPELIARPSHLGPLSIFCLPMGLLCIFKIQKHIAMAKSLSFLFLLFICCKETKTEKVTAPLESLGQSPTLDWLVGSWKRTNDEPGSTTYEHWKKINGTEYRGLGCTLHNKDTVWQERIRLIQENGRWNFEAKIPGEQRATVFPLSSLDRKGFVCGNEANEFPKKIAYSLVDPEHLKAVISGGGPEVLFEFKKMEIPVKRTE